MSSVLAKPLVLPSGLTLPNRIVKAPMTENLADSRNQPTVRHERVYRRWAEGGAGMLITGNLMVDRRYLERSRNIVADAHLDLPALRRVVEATGEVPIVAQLGHPGRQCTRYITGEPVAPSEVEAVALLGSFAKPRALTAAEVGDLVTAFAAAAVRCRDAGMDGVQVHAAHACNVHARSAVVVDAQRFACHNAAVGPAKEGDPLQAVAVGLYVAHINP